MVEYSIQTIRATKQKEIDRLIELEKRNLKKPLEKILNLKQVNHHTFKESLKVAGLSVIATLKDLKQIAQNQRFLSDVAKQAHYYSKIGAAALCIPTDQQFMQGDPNCLSLIAEELESLHPCPILSQDFVIHPYQIAESKKHGASAIVLMPELLKNQLKEFIEICDHIGLDALVPIKNEEELQLALSSKAQIIGLNLQKHEQMYVDIAKKLISMIPKDIVKVVFDEITSLQEAHDWHECKVDGVMVDELLKKSNDPQRLISDINNV